MIRFLCYGADNMNMEGLTVAEIAQILSIPEGTVRTRLSRKGIKPITNSPVYDKSAVEAIRNVKPKGWPRKKPGESSPPRQ